MQHLLELEILRGKTAKKKNTVDQSEYNCSSLKKKKKLK